MPSPGHKFVWKSIARSAFAGAEGIAPLHHKSWDDSVKSESVKEGLAWRGPQGAFGEPDEISDSQRNLAEKELSGNDAARRHKFRVEAGF